MKEFTLHTAQKSALLKNALFEEIYVQNCDLTKFHTAGRPAVPKLFSNRTQNNEILIDGAHNSLAASAIKKYLEAFDKKRKIIMLLGMMANKEHKKFIQILKNRVHSIITLNIPNQINFIEKAKLSKIAQSCGIPSKTENSIKKALKSIAKENENAIIFCTGSLYFVGEILNLN